ncbi:Crp/Fnr family transcriptional regulator [Clostridium sp. SM-530-WT-3G]|uniref:Crp/Fnr family transcriptional regulator n=1 Tax=Clostridium sp. SM-530-WT-3G TaxID=2725303 RepID=UPI00145C3D45|nr:Crp/Fnr family transcriptional regulator [Clostridium sp. SM-530-WT-3G]NME84190.1 Crp/Fnr family transcriptional regulator [Clostridium sp. SM-530-WT-3G]
MSKYVWENIMKNKGFVLDNNNIDLLNSIFKGREIKKNEFFLKQGDKSTEVAFVQKGVFRSFYIDAKGNDITKYFYAEDSVLFSYFAYLTNKESAYYIQALEDSYILVAKVSDFEKIIKGNYNLLYLYKKLLDEAIVIKEEHACSFKLLNSLERYKRFKAMYPNLEQRIKQHHLASYLGITPVSLSRIRNKGKINK